MISYPVDETRGNGRKQALSNTAGGNAKGYKPLFSCSVMSDCLWPPWTAARQASLSFSVSWSLLKLMSIKLMMLGKKICQYLKKLHLYLPFGQAVLFLGILSQGKNKKRHICEAIYYSSVCRTGRRVETVQLWSTQSLMNNIYYIHSYKRNEEYFCVLL